MILDRHTSKIGGLTDIYIWENHSLQLPSSLLLLVLVIRSEGSSSLLLSLKACNNRLACHHNRIVDAFSLGHPSPTGFRRKYYWLVGFFVFADNDICHYIDTLGLADTSGLHSSHGPHRSISSILWQKLYDDPHGSFVCSVSTEGSGLRHVTLQALISVLGDHDRRLVGGLALCHNWGGFLLELSVGGFLGQASS